MTLLQYVETYLNTPTSVPCINYLPLSIEGVAHNVLALHLCYLGPGSYRMAVLEKWLPYIW